MKNCKNFQDNIILYVENKLSIEEIEEMEKHIERCEKCNSYLEYVNQLLCFKDGNIDQNYWDFLTEKILKKIEEYKEIHFLRIFKIKKFALSFMIIFILTTLFLNIFQNQINLIRHLHLFKDYHIIKNLDTLKEIIALEEDYE
ncbi:MAG: zf-HC2 domain-containing protein [Candidatus Omnitrophica bacterium]|nr:zf-HC2 domain-containing protein [Candidatus Omnitrophota bacterium]